MIVKLKDYSEPVRTFFNILTRLDAAVFPEKPAVAYICEYPIGEGHSIACYNFDEKGIHEYDDSYFIYPPDVDRRWEIRSGPDADRMLFSLQGELLDIPIIPAIPRKFAAIAAHEVRHRIQHKRKIRMFEAEHAELCKDPLTSIMLRYVKDYADDCASIDRLLGKSSWQTPPIEFDAKVIEFLAMHLWTNEKGIERLTKLVQEEPPQS